MTLFGKRALGLEIRPDTLRAVALQRRGDRTVLLASHIQPLAEGVLVPSARALNVCAPEAFVAAVQAVLSPLLPLARGDARVAMAVPDAAGHVFLLAHDLPFRNRRHGREVLHWQLKDVLPKNAGQLSLEYQLLGVRPDGGRRVLVSVLERPVLAQYEALVQQAGYQPALVDFQALQLFSAYRPQLDLGEALLLIGVHSDQFSLMAVNGGQIDFYRVKAVEGQPERIFQELHRSLLAYRRDFPDLARCQVYAHIDGAGGGEVVEMIRSCFEQEVQLLDSPLSAEAGGAAGLAVAIGAAERLL